MSRIVPPDQMNEQMRKARNCALDILAPSSAELEHGVELHADSIVVESYGFVPRAAVDGDAMSRAIEAGASSIELKDMEESMRIERIVSDPDEQAQFKLAWDVAGVTCILINAGEEYNPVPIVLKRFAHHTYLAEMLRDFVPKAITPDDITEAKVRGRHCLYFTCNAVPLPQEWVSVQEELRYIRYFFQLGARMMHLTYNRRNIIGDGCAEKTDAGLSDFGRAVVGEMNRAGVIVDVAHSGYQTCLDAAGVSDKPVVASHTGCYQVNPHYRNKPDDVLKAIAETGGLVGVCCIPAFLGGAGDVTSMLDHIDHLSKTIGTDHIAIGTDVSYRSSRCEREEKKIPKRPKRRTPWRKFWAPDELHFKSEWRKPRQIMSMAWTNWPIFTVGLVQRGYCDEDIKKIIGGNVMRVARAVLE